MRSARIDSLIDMLSKAFVVATILLILDYAGIIEWPIGVLTAPVWLTLAWCVAVLLIMAVTERRN